jgi:hypothetical protein
MDQTPENSFKLESARGKPVKMVIPISNFLQADYILTHIERQSHSLGKHGEDNGPLLGALRRRDAENWQATD